MRNWIFAIFCLALAAPSIVFAESRFASASDKLGIGVPYPLEQINLLDTAEPLNAMIVANTAYGLLRKDNAGETHLQLAAGFNSNESKDIFVFSLRRNIFFPNGTAITERAVKASYEFLISSEAHKMKKSNRYDSLKNIKSIELLRHRNPTNNANRFQGIRFVLSNGDPNFLAKVATLPIVDAQHAALFGPDFGRGTLVTAAGPYLLRENRPEKGVVLEANPEFYRAGYPRSRILSFESFEDPLKALSALRVGSIDIIAFATQELMSAIEDDPTLELIDSPFPDFTSPRVANWKSEKLHDKESSTLILSKSIVRKSLELDGRFFENFDVSGVFLP